MKAKRSCEWPSDDPLMIEYHDREWGVPVHDDRKQFEFLVLEGAQAGLSWRTILHKREAFRAAFAGFDPEAVPDPTLPENLSRPDGRGVFLIRRLMDEVRFNDKGNSVCMMLRRS